jgi:hypothetical protein
MQLAPDFFDRLRFNFTNSFDKKSIDYFSSEVVNSDTR